uniref:Transcriptional activator protein Pur-alpha n=1 Tax=Mesocestoides corti TaxID=53468 RepID=A0A5K3EZN1_MESCO
MHPLIYRQQFPILPYPLQGVPRPLIDEEDLATVALQIHKKRFYVDVKKNWRGRFMKIAEVGMDGRKSRILLTMTAADDFKDKVLDIVNIYEELVKKSEEQPSPSNHDDKDDGIIKSHILNYPHRRYYLDLKRNQRGYFLRVTMLSTSARIKLAIPAEGMRELHDSICGLLKTWWNRTPSNNEKKDIVLPEPKVFRIDNRTLYFDSVSNRYGVFLRISQVWASSRTAITIPGRSVSKFRDIINELAEHLSATEVGDNESPTHENVQSDVNEPESPEPTKTPSPEPPTD